MNGNGKGKKKKQQAKASAGSAGTTAKNAMGKGADKGMYKPGDKKYSTYKGVRTEWTFNGKGWEGRPVKKA